MEEGEGTTYQGGYEDSVRHMSPDLVAMIEKEEEELTRAERLMIAGSVKLTKARELYFLEKRIIYIRV